MSCVWILHVRMSACGSKQNLVVIWWTVSSWTVLFAYLPRIFRSVEKQTFFMLESGSMHFICNLHVLLSAGLVLAFYTMSVWPEMADRASRCPPGRTLVVTIVTYLVEIFFFVWTVAYNFVPGGVYTREHTDYLIAAVMLGLFVGLFISE